MQPKKNPKADLNKDRNLYFVIGLTLVLGVTWGAIEYKTYEKVFDLAALDMLEDDDEDIPITEQLKTPPPPPPPPPAPEVIEVVEDEEEVEETVIESTETDQDEIIIEEIEVEEEFDDIDVPFAVIEDVPIFPGCEVFKPCVGRRDDQQATRTNALLDRGQKVGRLIKPVDQVSHRPAQYQRIGGYFSGSGMPEDQARQDHRYDQRNPGKKPPLPARGVCQKTEGGTRI